MSQLADMLAEDLAAMAADAGEALVYTGSDGVEIEIADGIFAPRPPDLRAVQDGQAVVRTATAIVPATAVAEPRAGDWLARGDEIWTVKTRQPIAGGAWWRLELARSETAEKSRQNYRLRR